MFKSRTPASSASNLLQKAHLIAMSAERRKADLRDSLHAKDYMHRFKCCNLAMKLASFVVVSLL